MGDSMGRRAFLRAGAAATACVAATPTAAAQDDGGNGTATAGGNATDGGGDGREGGGTDGGGGDGPNVDTETLAMYGVAVVVAVLSPLAFAALLAARYRTE